MNTGDTRRGAPQSINPLPASATINKQGNKDGRLFHSSIRQVAATSRMLIGKGSITNAFSTLHSMAVIYKINTELIA